MTKYLMETGDSWFGDGVCTGYPKCGSGEHATCIRFIGPNFTTCHGVHYPCIFESSSMVTLYYYSGGSWIYLASANRPGGYGYSWICFNHTGYTQSLYLKAHDAETNTDSFFYFNWYYTTIHTTNQNNDAMAGVEIYIDGGLAGTTDAYGNLQILRPLGSFLLKTVPVITSSYTCENMVAEVCSQTVNVTGDSTVTVKHYPMNNCVSIYHGATIYNGGTFTGECKNTWVNISKPACFVIWVTGVAEDKTWAEFKLTCPWTPYGDFTEENVIVYAHSWSKEWVHSSGTFKFYIGDIWWTLEVQWAKIEQFCYINRINYGGMGFGVVDNSAIYVDCSSGSNENTGFCTFDDAVATITHAMTLVANNGTIYVKYGNCLDETLAIVLNPIVDTVHISPRLNDETEGTGSIIIDGT